MTYISVLRSAVRLHKKVDINTKKLLQLGVTGKKRELSELTLRKNVSTINGY